MQEVLLEEILERLARQNDSTKEQVRKDLEAYLEEIFSEEEPEDMAERLAWQQEKSRFPEGKPGLGEYLGRLSEEMAYQKRRMEDLWAFYGEG